MLPDELAGIRLEDFVDRLESEVADRPPRRKSSNEARDQLLYRLCCDHVPYKTVAAECRVT